MMHPLLEIACFDLSSALVAAEQGAHRIEFASDYSSGGVTPDINSFRTLRNKTKNPIYILIRCRAGNFHYTEREIQTMEKSIHAFTSAGADGFVFGCLNENNEVDKAANVRLLQAAGSLPCTFHRAIDRTIDLQEAQETIIDLGISGILSSGGKATAMEGAEILKNMIEKSDGKITIMPGGGIRSDNLQQLRETCPSDWFHSACIPHGSDSIDAAEIEKMLKILQH